MFSLTRYNTWKVLEVTDEGLTFRVNSINETNDFDRIVIHNEQRHIGEIYFRQNLTVNGLEYKDIGNIEILRTYRGNGLGMKLYLHAKSIMIELGFSGIYSLKETLINTVQIPEMHRKIGVVTDFPTYELITF